MIVFRIGLPEIVVGIHFDAQRGANALKTDTLSETAEYTPVRTENKDHPIGSPFIFAAEKNSEFHAEILTHPDRLAVEGASCRPFLIRGKNEALRPCGGSSVQSEVGRSWLRGQADRQEKQDRHQ